MKKILLSIIVITIVLIYPIDSIAEEVFDNYNFSEINDIVSENTIDVEFDFEENLSKIINGNKIFDNENLFIKIFDVICNEIKENMSVVIFLVAFSVFGALISNIQTSFNSEGVGEIAFLSIYFIFVTILIKGFSSCYDMAKDALQTQIAFIKASLPIYVASIASSGHVTTAALINTAFLTLTHFCANLIERFLFPATYLIFLLSVVNNATEKIQISKIIILARQTINWILGLSMTIFVGFLSLSGLKSAAIDNLGMKTIKYTMGSFVPVIGGLLSDTIDTVVSTTSIIRNSIGIVSIIGIILVCIFPLIKLIVITWLYKLASGLVEPVSERCLGNIISSAASTIQILFTFLLATTIIMILSTGIIMSICR